MESEPLKFDEWCILEIMGHQRYAGRVTEHTIAGQSFLRIEIPASRGQVAFTKFFSASSVYAITPTTEELALGVAEQLCNVPISVYDLPEAMREKLRSKPALGYDPVEADELDEENEEEPF